MLFFMKYTTCPIAFVSFAGKKSLEGDSKFK